jgi:four helix bundle protein
LGTWQLARKLVVFIYQITDNFPEREKFGITNQIRRAANSVSANIAEGSARVSSKDQAHFSTIAYASLIEVLNFMIIASDLKFVDLEQLEQARGKIGTLSLKINNLKNRQLLSSKK